jgi:hypothetical protein
MNHHTCLRCDYKWESDNEQPKRCASCRSPLWNTPYQRGAKAIDPLITLGEWQAAGLCVVLYIDQRRNGPYAQEQEKTRVHLTVSYAVGVQENVATASGPTILECVQKCYDDATEFAGLDEKQRAEYFSLRRAKWSAEWNATLRKLAA